MRIRNILRVIALTLVACAFALVLSTCGSSKKGAVVQGFSPGSSPGAKTSPEGLDYQEAVSLDDTLAGLDALETPDDVDPALFAQLKSALGEALHEQWGASTSRSGVSSEFVGSPGLETDSPRGMGKLVSTPPTGNENRVTDLAITDNGGGNYTLSWHYRNLGDYDQSGTVGISDITPIAMHYGETYEIDDENCLLAVIDGSGNGIVDIADITPIAMNYGVECVGYVVQTGEATEGPFSDLTEVSLADALNEGRKSLKHILALQMGVWVRVVPVDSSGVTGIPSDPIQVPIVENYPPIAKLTVNHGEGPAPLTVDLSASQSYDPDGSIVKYEWDWEGDGTYDDDTGLDSSVSHTYNSNGTFHPTVKVTDDDNAFSTDFVPVTVGGEIPNSEWVHTWGGPANDVANDIAVDGNGNLFVAGTTSSFGVALTDLLVLKYSTDGELLWSKTWGGNRTERGHGIALDANGNAYVVGETDSFVGKSPFVLLKYSSVGTLVWEISLAWGDPGVAKDVSVDDDGSIYVLGPESRTSGVGILLVKFDEAGAITWARSWGRDSSAAPEALAIDATGDVYVTGQSHLGPYASDVFLLKWGSDGDLKWQTTWGAASLQYTHALAVDFSGNVYISGETWAFGAGGRDAFLLKYDSDGNLLWQRTWGGPSDESAKGVTATEEGDVYVVGWTQSFGRTGSGVFLLRYSATGSLLSERVWLPDYDNNEVANAVTAYSAGRIYIAGAMNSGGGFGFPISGEWSSITGEAYSPSGSTTTPAASVSEPSHTESTVDGTETLPEGVEDEGGGGDEVLVIKYAPSLF